MHASSLLTLGATAALATAAPASQTANTFSVTNFVYGCTVGCDYNFDVTIGGDSSTHPAVTTPVHCEGSKSPAGEFAYVDCGSVSETQTVSAAINGTSVLGLRYEVRFPEEGSYYRYFGEKEVNAATSGRPQEEAFVVEESSAIGVA